MSIQVTAALLAARVFQSVDALGLNGAEVRRRGLSALTMSGGRGDLGEEVAHQLRQLAGHASVTPELATQVQLVIGRCDRRPIRLLSMSHGVSMYHVGHLFPVDVFHHGSPANVVSSDALTLTADTHLHSGASFGLRDLVGLSICSPALPALWDVVGQDCHGRFYSPGVLLCALRTFLAARCGLQQVAALCDPELIQFIDDGVFWKRVLATAERPSASDDGGSFALERLAAWPSFDAAPFDAVKVVRDLVEVEKHALIGTVDETNVYGMISALFLLTAFLRSRPSEGLPSFVSRFERMSAFRKGVSGRLTRERVIEAAVDHVLCDDEVRGAEFRKSILAVKPSEVRDDVLDSLRDHLRAFAASKSVQRLPRKLTMPVTFTRANTESNNQFGLQLRHDLANVWSVGAGFAEALERSDDVLGCVGAVDVVGNELAQPNWVFIPVLLELRSRFPALTVSCHAGESFNWPLQGIRSVGELVAPNAVVHRIGHALSLDLMVSDFVVGSGTMEFSRFEVINDLCWMVACGLGGSDSTDFLQMVIEDASLDEVSISPASLVEAWLARRTLSGFADLGISGLNLAGGVAPFARLYSSSSPAAWHFAVLTHTGEGLLAGLSSALSEPLAQQYREFNEAWKDQCSSFVLSLIEAENIVVESCPTSNLRLSGLPKAKYLPTARWAAMDLRITVSSDDPVIFGTNVRNELALIEANFGGSLANEIAHLGFETCCGIENNQQYFLAQAEALT